MIITVPIFDYSITDLKYKVTFPGPMTFSINDARICLAFKFCFLGATLASQLCCLTKIFYIILRLTMIHTFEFHQHNPLEYNYPLV